MDEFKQLDELREASQSVIEWIKKYCDPYESVVINLDEINVVSVNSGIPI